MKFSVVCEARCRKLQSNQWMTWLATWEPGADLSLSDQDRVISLSHCCDTNLPEWESGRTLPNSQAVKECDASLNLPVTSSQHPKLHITSSLNSEQVILASPRLKCNINATFPHLPAALMSAYHIIAPLTSCLSHLVTKRSSIPPSPTLHHH
jgi:hypothetical protein